MDTGNIMMEFVLWFISREGPTSAKVGPAVLFIAATICSLAWYLAYTAPAAKAQQPLGGNTTSTGQQGGITAGSIGTINNYPAPAKPDNATKIVGLTALIERGTRIKEDFEKSNDVGAIQQQFEQWNADTDKFLRESLDPSYAIQFRNAPPYTMARAGMAVAGTGYWQHLIGRLGVLTSFIPELRRGG